MRAQGARCVACKQTLRMQKRSARATISATSVHGASARRDVRCGMTAQGSRCVARKRTLRMRQ
eukprot:1646432-Pleurochrysis_carterae.AAC.1